MKRSLSIFLCIAMLLGITPVQAYASAGESAANAPKEEWTQTSVKVAPDPGLPENDELYDGYVEQLFYGKDVAVFGTAAGERLIGDEKLLYDALVPLIRQLASGQRASSFLCIGQEVTDDKGTVYPVDAEVVFAEPMISDASLGRVVDALLADLPYEMYWYDKVDGCEAAIIHGSTMLQICLRFTVADNYRGTDDYSVDTTKAKTATAAAANAQKLIDDYASASDYEKLVSYKDDICALVSYDHAAADDGHFSTDNDPWQLIYVFDGDDSTNVVCEGYSKAFMYLCDMTAFAGDVSCYTVMGTMDDGNHMWNVVSIGGGNYLTDVTNSDVGTVGQDGSFFLTGASGSAAEGYVVDGHTYRYDEDTRNLWGTDAESILTLKNTPYDPSAENTEVASGTCGKNLTWTLGSDGVLVISGTGKMNNYYGENAPWYSKRSKITGIVVKSGVSSIGSWAFYGCSSLTSIKLPDTITSIGTCAFYECSSLTSIELPDTITSIGDSTFCVCRSLTSIVIPDSVTSIARRAFSGCSSLTSIKLPDNLTSIGDDVFNACRSLTSIEIPDSVTSIGSGAFFECCNLTSIKLPDNLTSIGSNTFYHCCSLTSIVIPDRVTSIDSSVFAYCNSLTSITFNGNAPNIASDAFYALRATCYYPGNNETWTEAVMQNYGGTITWLVIGSTQGPGGGSGSGEEPGEGSGEGSGSVSGSGTGGGGGSGSGGSGGSGTGSGSGESSDGVGEITWTFEDGVLTISGTGKMPDYMNNNEPPWDDVMDEITSLVIEPGVTSIGIYAFSSASIVEIDLPSSIAYIEPGAFAGCDKIASITVAKGNQKYTVVDGVLFNRNMTTLVLYPSASTAKTYTIPNTVTALSGYAFSKARNLKQINIPNTVQELGFDTFHGCTNLTEVIIPNGVTAIGRAVFDGCTSLKYVSIPNSVGTIGLCAFYGCESLSNLQIPDSVTTIGIQAFYGCSSLVELTIPDSVVSIGNHAFGGCKSLVSVYLGQGVTSMENGALDSQYLKDIQVAKGNQYFASVDGVLFNKDKTELLCYPGGREVQSYTIPNTVTDIGSYAFLCCMNLTSMVIPDGVTSIGRESFAYCINLTNIQLPDGVTSIGQGAFGDCRSLTSIEIRDGVTSIGSSAFYGCSNLTSIKIPDSVSSIGNNAFEECYSLTSIEIPNSVSSIGNDVFKDCSSLTSIEIPDSVTSIGSSAFYGCSSLTSIEIPDSVTSIGSSAFSRCSSLTSIEIPDSVTSIGSSAFYGCSNLTSIKIPDGVTSIGSNAFANCSSLKEIFFTGNAPTIAKSSFSGVTATAYYPPDDATWTSDKRVGYGGSITWVPFRVKLDTPKVSASNDASTGKIKLTWQAVDGATQYKVYRATSKTGKYKLMKTTTGTSYTNTSSQVGEKFYYYVWSLRHHMD